MTTAMGATTDAELWRRVREGDREAFEAVVKRHQGAVAAVACNACGDLVVGEDVAQEAFWAAWRGRDSLRDPNRLRPWLCGIARNLGANAARAAARSTPVALGGLDVAGAEDDPAASALRREERAVIWRALEALPDGYREPLVLYYRQDESVAEVAATLELSENAVKQRLARGRAMLRDRLAGLVEEGLRRGKPGRSFTTAVMAGLGANLVAKPAAAGAIGAVAPTAAASGMLGALLGPLLGLTGAWLGAWLPAQAAPTVREREMVLKSGRRIFVVGLAFAAVVAGLVYVAAGTRWYVPAWIAAMVGFQGWLFLQIWGLNRRLREARADATASDEPNRTAARRAMTRLANQARGRSYRSRAVLFGLPLLDVHVADPPGFDEDGVEVRPTGPRGTARGWIAVGDDARGVLLAVGGRAIGGIAVGGRALGVVAFGGVAVGVLGFGGLAVGGLALGGAAVGGIAVGGLAVGVDAAGGGAVGWRLAIGGLALAWEVAIGDASIAPRPIDPGLAFRWLHAGPAPSPALATWVASAFRRLLSGGQIVWLVLGAAAMTIEAARTAAMYRRRRG